MALYLGPVGTRPETAESPLKSFRVGRTEHGLAPTQNQPLLDIPLLETAQEAVGSDSAIGQLSEGFLRGGAETLSLGAFDLTEDSEFGLNPRFIGEVAGSIAVEIGLVAAGIGVVKHLAQTPGRLLRLAAYSQKLRQSAQFGTRVKGLAVSPEVLTDVAVTGGLEVGRTAVNAFQGEEIDSEDLTRFAFATTLPFIPALNQARKSKVGLEESIKDAFKHIDEIEGELADYVGPRVVTDRGGQIRPLGETHEALEGSAMKSAEVFKRIGLTDAEEMIEMGERWRLTSGGPDHIDALMRAWRAGAPMNELLALPTADDVADYMLRNNIKTKQGAAGRFEARGTDEPIVINSVLMEERAVKVNRTVDLHTARITEAPDPQSQAEALEVENVFREYFIGHPKFRTELDARNRGIKIAPSKGRDAALRFARLSERNDSVGEVMRLGTTYDGVRKPITGAAGLRPIGEFDEVVEGDVLDVAHAALAQPPKSLSQKAYDKTILHYGFAKRTIASTLRALQAIGPEGQQLGQLMARARLWMDLRTGSSVSWMRNLIKEATPEEVVEFVRAAETGGEVVSPNARALLTTYKAIQKDIRDNYVQLGGTVRVEIKDKNGQTVGLTRKALSDVELEHYFPHFHTEEFWDEVRRNPEKFEEVAGAVRDVATSNGLSFSQVFDVVIRQKLQETTHSMHLRVKNIPGWMGDPDAFDAASGEAYKAQVQQVLAWFFEDNYSAIGRMRHLGAPTNLEKFSDIKRFTDLEPVHEAIAARLNMTEPLESTGFAARVARLSDKTPAEIEQMARRAGVFHSVRGLSDDPELLAEEFGKSVAELSDDQVARIMFHQAMTGGQFRESVYQWGGIAKVLLQRIGEKGGDRRFAEDAVDAFMGIKLYDESERKLSEMLRSYNIVTKLGLAVVENATQSVFTATRFGIKNTYLAFKDALFDKNATMEFAREAGVLSEDLMRVVEVEANNTIVGKFLESTGFSAVERMNRVVAATAGKHYLMQNVNRLRKNSLDKVARNAFDNLGLDVKQLVDDAGQWTDLGLRVLDDVEARGSGAVLPMLQKMAGFNASRGTQFLADLLDTPLASRSPFGKVVFQFKSFMFNATRMFVNNIFGEAVEGGKSLGRGDFRLAASQFAPLARMMLLGIAVGEATQDARMIVSGRDPMERGQSGVMRELLGDYFPDDDEEFMRVLGQRMSRNDLAARAMENFAGVGFAGIAMSMLQSALMSGKVGLANLVLGPTIGSGLEVAGQGVQAFRTGNLDPVIRKAEREGIAALGALPGVRNIPGAAFASTAAGRNVQLALNPSEAQLETSIYVTPEEISERAIRSVVREYNVVRERALAAATAGDRDSAIETMRAWNGKLGPKIEMLREFDALNRQSAARISFSREDMQGVIVGGIEASQEPGIVAQGLGRIGALAERSGLQPR